MFSNFKRDMKDGGISTAWYNLKFMIAYKMLDAKSMRVSRK